MKSNGQVPTATKSNGQGRGAGKLNRRAATEAKVNERVTATVPASPTRHENGQVAARRNGHGRVPAPGPGLQSVPARPSPAMKLVGQDAFRVFASSIARLVEQGNQRILITSSGPGEGKSTITAALARALARSGRMSAAVVDADTVRPRIHDLFQLENRRGLGELLTDVYHVDLGRENPDQFGVGDWIELIRAQCRTGKLQISEESQEFTIVFNKGRLVSLSDHPGLEQELLGEMLVEQGRINADQRDSALRVQEEGSRPLGDVLQGLGFLRPGELDVVLKAQFQERLQRLVTMRQPRFHFSETVEAYLPAAAGAPPGDSNGSGIDRFVVEMAGDYLKQPYLISQVPGYLKDTGMENLKVLTCGERSLDLCDAHYASPFRMVLDRLAKRFDVVLIDSPPVAFDSATASLAHSVDGVVLVVKANELNVEVIQQAKEHLTRSGANILGVALNQVELFKDEALSYYHSVHR